jgi:magnesium transporter
MRPFTIPTRTPVLPATNTADLKLRCKPFIYKPQQLIAYLTYLLLLFVGTEFDQNGLVKTTAGDIRKSEFCQLHSLLPRDLRTIDTRSVNQKPSILVRSEAILINMAHMRALLKSDLVVIFDPLGSTNSYNQSVFVYDLQERLRSKNDQLPFEFKQVPLAMTVYLYTIHLAHLTHSTIFLCICI